MHLFDVVVPRNVLNDPEHGRSAVDGLYEEHNAKDDIARKRAKEN